MITLDNKKVPSIVQDPFEKKLHNINYASRI
jgi:hypothetical protein